MFKKIAILAIVIGILITGNLLASLEDPLTIYVTAQDEVDWTLMIWDGVQYPWTIYGQGDYPPVNATGCQGDYYEMWALDETHFIESGTLPHDDTFEIEIPITVPSWEEQEE